MSTRYAGARTGRKFTRWRIDGRNDQCSSDRSRCPGLNGPSSSPGKRPTLEWRPASRINQPERPSGDIWESSREIRPTGCLHELFEAQSSTCGDAPAVVCSELVLSYSEVEAASNRLARQLQSAGACPGSLIGLCLNRSERPIIAILACLKAGAAYVPIDPTHPDERVRYIIERG